jgi:hypothetical protein
MVVVIEPIFIIQPPQYIINLSVTGNIERRRVGAILIDRHQRLEK